MWKNGFNRKIMLVSKFTTSKPGYQPIAILILRNISRSKDNQIMKFGQLIENIFLKDHRQNVVERLSPELFLKKLKLSISLDQ